jgi:hypothetical protein
MLAQSRLLTLLLPLLLLVAMQGTLPSAVLASATSLKRLNVNSNRLSGTLPAAVSALSSMTELSLAFNSFEGTVPAAFADLTKLKTL